MHLEKTLREILPLVRKPARYTGGERNIVRKDPASVPLHVALAFPEVYEIGMSHLGMRILYHVINSRDDALADRVYTPWVDMEARMREKGLPLWGLETMLPLRDFGLVGISLMHELMYTNVLTLLDLGGIPLHAAERTEEDPLVLGGGPCVSNPEPVAPYFDAFVIGEGEEVIGEILDAWKAVRAQGGGRRDTLAAIARLDGVYRPDLYRPRPAVDGRIPGVDPASPAVPERIERRWPTRLKPEFYPDAPITPLTQIVQDRLDVELFRGCNRGCRFCHAGYFYRPVRERDAPDVVSQVQSGLEGSGWEEFGLLSLSTSDYTNIEPLLTTLSRDLVGDHVSCSLPSLRADNFPFELADAVSSLRRAGLTFAPEAGSERLGRVINKAIPHETILETARTAYRKGWSLIKCYFMVGLPTETDADIDALVDLCLAIHRMGREAGPGRRLNVSVGSFVPKPHTPFQWEAFGPPAILRDRIAEIRRRLRVPGIRVKWHSVDTSRIEAALARGGREMADVIHEAWSLGCRFDEWTEQLRPALWEEAMRRHGLPIDDLLRERRAEDPLPWDHIDTRVLRKHLLRERRKAFEGQVTDDCRWTHCNACGIPGAPKDNVLTAALPDAPVADAPSPAAPSPEEPAARLRLVYRKEGAIQFISHLDLMQVFLRVFRAAGLPLYYTRGRSPHPRLTAGPPLPTGLAGEREILDVYLSMPPASAVASSLNDRLPDGLGLVDVFPVPIRSAAPSALAVWADHQLLIPANGRLSPDRVRRAVAEFLSLDQRIVSVERKGRARTVDLRAAVGELAVTGDSPATLSFSSRVLDDAGNTASPTLVLRTLFGLSADEVARLAITRTRLRTGDHTPLYRPETRIAP